MLIPAMRCAGHFACDLPRRILVFRSPSIAHDRNAPAVPPGQAATVDVEVGGVSFAQRFSCSSASATLSESAHRLCIISRPVSRSTSTAGVGAAPDAPQLWQRQWVVIKFAKVRMLTL